MIKIKVNVRSLPKVIYQSLMLLNCFIGISLKILSCLLIDNPTVKLLFECDKKYLN